MTNQDSELREDEISPENTQRNLPFLVDQLRKMHSELPEHYQLCISYELLRELANSLVNDTVYDIVNGLLESQHATENNLHKRRCDIEKDYELEVETWKSKISDPEELQHILGLIKIKHSKQLENLDLQIVTLLDVKVTEQQTLLQKAGVAGFYVTNSTEEIQIQMLLLDFILRLSRLKHEDNK